MIEGELGFRVYLHECIIDSHIVLRLAFIAKVKERRHLSALVVPSKQPNSARIIKLQSKQKQQNFDRKTASVDVVPQK